MVLKKAEKQDMAAVKRLWQSRFEDGTAGFADFVTERMGERIYIAIEGDDIAAMLIAAATLEYSGRKGFYLYSACTAPSYRKKGYMKALTDFAIASEKENGASFCVLKPTNDELFDFWAKLGFTGTSSVREFTFDIKKNIWQSADFDIVTAGRFSAVREKFADENIVHYSKKDYELFTRYLYTFGGSTAENENAYAVYYIENDILQVKEIFARSTTHAIALLQAVRERTGCEKANICVPENSTLFLGEGSVKKRYAFTGLDDNAYINLMFE